MIIYSQKSLFDRMELIYIKDKIKCPVCGNRVADKEKDSEVIVSESEPGDIYVKCCKCKKIIAIKFKNV